MPKVLIADALSERAAAIFAERGIEVDVKIGLTPDALKDIIGNYDGLAVRSATKVTKAVLERASRLKVVGRAGIGVDNIDVAAATAARHRRDEHALRQLDHHRRARHRHDVRARPPDPGRRPLDPGRQMGEVALHGRRARRQDAGRRRLRQYRLDRRRPRHRPEDEGRRPTTPSSRPSAPSTSASRRSSSTSSSPAPTSSPCTRR